MAKIEDMLNRVNALKCALIRYSVDLDTSVFCLKKQQIDIVYASENGDVMTVLPTGFGKSLAYELIPYYIGVRRCQAACSCTMICKCPLREYLTSILVVSPLNAIIHEKAKYYGERCMQIMPERFGFESVMSHMPTYILGHPEHLLQKGFLGELKKNIYQEKVSHIIVDEAHCIETWGENFRTDYRQLDLLRAILPKAKVVALTATATKTTKKHIAKHLRFCANYSLVSASCDRPNLFYSVNSRPSHNSVNKTPEEAYEEVLKPILMELKEKGRSFPKTVLFSKLRWCGFGHELALQIMDDGELHCHTSDSPYTARLGQYHAPQVDTLKQELSCLFKSQDSHVRLLLATEAYSMGADAPDIRRVIHIGPPSTLETYLQETGRAGRDGEPAEATVYCNKSDISSNIKHLSQEMKDFCTTNHCRRQTLMNYFEFECVPPEPGHLCCDNCTKTCQCDECVIHKVLENDFNLSEEIHEPIFVSKKDAVKMALQLLTDYFEAENQVANMPFSNVKTGLDKKLASKISADYVRLSNADILKSEYKDIDCAYLNNVASLLKYVFQHFHYS